ncbi:galectin-1-like [Bombina bombina]|uniref:galectin-1-like n=1 Tax=Bombina bombina TaxID=8345 RepID=UPI00235AE90A|nr:galectin-1-like [Bombina bombina]
MALIVPLVASLLTITNLNLSPGQILTVTGIIDENASTFQINLGTDENNFLFHFSPRFEFYKDRKVIALNTKTDGIWGRDQQTEYVFPFKKGEETSLLFVYQGNKIKVILPGGDEIVFPFRKQATILPYMNLKNLRLKSLTVI